MPVNLEGSGERVDTLVLFSCVFLFVLGMRKVVAERGSPGYKIQQKQEILSDCGSICAQILGEHTHPWTPMIKYLLFLYILYTLIHNSNTFQIEINEMTMI